VKELYLLLDEKHRKFIELLCSNSDKEKRVDKCLKHSEMPNLLHLHRVSKELDISPVTTRKLVRRFERLGLIVTTEIGRSKIILPTTKLWKIWEEVKEVREAEVMESEVE